MTGFVQYHFNQNLSLDYQPIINSAELSQPPIISNDDSIIPEVVDSFSKKGSIYLKMPLALSVVDKIYDGNSLENLNITTEGLLGVLAVIVFGISTYFICYAYRMHKIVRKIEEHITELPPDEQ